MKILQALEKLSPPTGNAQTEVKSAPPAPPQPTATPQEESKSAYAAYCERLLAQHERQVSRIKQQKNR